MKHVPFSSYSFFYCFFIKNLCGSTKSLHPKDGILFKSVETIFAMASSSESIVFALWITLKYHEGWFWVPLLRECVFAVSQITFTLFSTIYEKSFSINLDCSRFACVHRCSASEISESIKFHFFSLVVLKQILLLWKWCVPCINSYFLFCTYILQAKLETKALKAKRPGFTDERYHETSYFIENGE